jgi:hypothetical protein
MALGVASIAAVAQGIRRHGEWGPLSVGAAAGRDVILLAVASLVTAFLSAARSGSDLSAGLVSGQTFVLGLFALLIGAAVALNAVIRERTGRHVYAIQSAVVLAYGLLRVGPLRQVRPEIDAAVALGYGFILVGITVQARRAGIAPVEQAARRFAALLPVGLGFILPAELSLSTAAAAAGSGVLYSALAFVEKSRLFGSLGAVAANAALLVAALATGLRGVEVYLAPVGLLFVLLGHIFRGSLDAGARQTVRVLGSILLYAPAAVQLTFRIGNAESGLYPLFFGLAALLAVGAGMLLQIRAYLFLGTGFLVLDVIASLVHVGLRDHRIGFLVLSLSGLAILGTMVWTTLQREQFRRLVTRLSGRLAGWD